jgi:hypothetical protein
VVLSHGRITLDVRLSAATRETIIDAMSHRPSALLAAEIFDTEPSEGEAS